MITDAANEVGDNLQNDVRWQRISVPYQFPVAFVRGLFDPKNALLAQTIARDDLEKRHRCFFIIDEGLDGDALSAAIKGYFDAHAEQLELIADAMFVPGGEIVKKDLAYVERMLSAIHTHGIDRHSYVIAIGGGAVMDAVGLAAATAHRGVRHIRIPTTVLSQNDSGVGVKNAVNFRGLKNYVGTFAPPWAVLNDFDFLNSLPTRERIAGLAEAVKVALIRDREFYLWLEENADAIVDRDVTVIDTLVERSIRNKAEIVRQDEKEAGIRALLNLGHSFGHALESETAYRRFLHGEAVAIGMVTAARLSERRGLCTAGTSTRLMRLLSCFELPVAIPADLDVDALASALSLDKKAVASGLRLVLLHAIGDAAVDSDSHADEIRAALEESRS